MTEDAAQPPQESPGPQAQQPRAAPTVGGMTPEQAAEAGQAMLASAQAQKEQLAQGFHAQRQAVLDQVAQQQAEVPTPQDLGAGVPPRDPARGATSQPTPTYTKDQIDAALRALGDAAPAAQPAPVPQGQVLVMQEIVNTLRSLIATEVRAQLEAAGLTMPAQKKTPN